MLRKLLIPVACMALLGGCVSYGYSDDGYYYGRPTTQYYGGAGYGYGGYPYGYGGPYRYGYGASPYGYGYPYYSGPRYYGYPYYPSRPRPPQHGNGPRPDNGHNRPDRPGNGNHRPPPWRGGGWAEGQDRPRVPRPQMARPEGIPAPQLGQRPVRQQAMPAPPRAALQERQMERIERRSSPHVGPSPSRSRNGEHRRPQQEP